MSSTPLLPVGTPVEVTARWWRSHDELPTVAIITSHLTLDPKFAYGISIGDGRTWVMAAHEVRPISRRGPWLLSPASVSNRECNGCWSS